MKTIVLLAVTASLSACATTGAHLAAADAKVASVQAGFDAARGIAALFLPFLDPAQRQRIEALGAAVEVALDAARTATSAAAKAQALDRADKAAADYRLATGA